MFSTHEFIILKYSKWIYLKIENILWNFRDSRKLWHIYQFRTQCEEINAISRRMQLLSLSLSLSLLPVLGLVPGFGGRAAARTGVPAVTWHYHRRIWQTGINWLILTPFLPHLHCCVPIMTFSSPSPGSASSAWWYTLLLYRSCTVATVDEEFAIYFWEYISDYQPAVRTWTLRCLLVLQTSQ